MVQGEFGTDIDTNLWSDMHRSDCNILKEITPEQHIR